MTLTHVKGDGIVTAGRVPARRVLEAFGFLSFFSPTSLPFVFTLLLLFFNKDDLRLQKIR